MKKNVNKQKVEYNLNLKGDSENQLIMSNKIEFANINQKIGFWKGLGLGLIFTIFSIFICSIVSAQATLDEAKKLLPKFSVGGIGTVMIIFIIVIVILICLGVGLYFLIRHLKFNRNIVILEDVSGSNNLEVVGRDKAMLVKVGAGGTELLYLKKRKVYRGSYGKRMGKNTYYFAIGKDGYWYNVTLGDLDPALEKVNIKTTSTNMRYQNESLQELIKNRFDKPSFWAQYGALLVNLGFFVLIAVMFWLYFDKLSETAPAITQASDTLRETAEALKQVVGGIDTLRGSGGLG